MPWHDDPLVDKARSLYLKAHRLAGTEESAIVEPMASNSGRHGDLITLGHGGEVIARYRVRPPGRRLRRLHVPGHPKPRPAITSAAESEDPR